MDEFYEGNPVKPKKDGIGGKLIVVALICSLLGGICGAGLMGLTTAVDTAAGADLPGNDTSRQCPSGRNHPFGGKPGEFRH